MKRRFGCWATPNGINSNWSGVECMVCSLHQTDDWHMTFILNSFIDLMEQRSMLLLPLLLLFRCSIYPPFWVHSLSVSVSVCLFVYLCIFFSIVCLLTRGANPSNMKLMDSITTKHVSASLLIAAVESKILKMPVGIAKRVISCMRLCAIVWVFCSFSAALIDWC